MSDAAELNDLKIKQALLNQEVDILKKAILDNQDRLDKHMTNTEQAIQTLSQSQVALTNTLNMIKYLMIGGSIVFVGSKMGWVEALKLIL